MCEQPFGLRTPRCALLFDTIKKVARVEYVVVENYKYKAHPQVQVNMAGAGAAAAAASQYVKGKLVERAESALEAAVGLLPPPPPAPLPPFPPGYISEDDPDAASFIGSIVFFISFASAFADILESEYLTSSCFRGGSGGGGGSPEYNEFPVYNALALGVGSAR
jgi:hypothetical protein